MKETVALVELVAVTVSTVGAPAITGKVVIEFDGRVDRELPTLLVAVTVKV